MNVKTSMKISIITVSYNAVKTIEQTIQSVLSQTYDNIEYIIIDGGSTDGTVDVIKKYEDKIAHWISEPDTGIYNAMNKGIVLATGEFIYFIGADDWLYNDNVIADVIPWLNGNYDIVCGKVYLIDKQNKIKYLHGNKLSRNDVMVGKMAPHQGMFTSKNIIIKFNEKYKVAADYEFFLKMVLEDSRVHFIDLIIANYDLSGISSIDYKTVTDEYSKIINEFLNEDFVKIYKKEHKRNKFKDILKNNLRKILFKLCIEKEIKKLKGWEKL